MTRDQFKMLVTNITSVAFSEGAKWMVDKDKGPGTCRYTIQQITDENLGTYESQIETLGVSFDDEAT